MLELPDKKYNIIYADPPWNIGGYVKETKKGMNDYRLSYETMTSSAIINLPIYEIAANNAILFMWVVDAKIAVVNKIMNVWDLILNVLDSYGIKRLKPLMGVMRPIRNLHAGVANIVL
jgi:N6-adenosine-specific RNA methylase IME4